MQVMTQKINLNLLYTLEVLLTERHVSRAAERLNLTQSAVSRQLSQLREIYNDPLLVRSGNHYLLTPRAEQINGELERVLKEITQVLGESHFDPMAYAKTVTFSSSDYVAQYIFPEIVAHLSKLAPAMTFAYRLWEPENLTHLGEIDVQLSSTMLPEAPKSLSSLQIGEDRPVIVMRRCHPLAKHSILNEQDLETFSHIRISGGGDKDSFLKQSMKERGLERRILASTPFFSSAFALLNQNDALLTLPLHIAINLKDKLGLHVSEFPFSVPSYKYWLIWHPKYDRDPAHIWLREHVHSIMRTSMYSVH